MSGPLSGLRVIEVAGLGAAPYGCMMLADLGASVIRIDRTEVDGGEVVLDAPLQRNRQSVALDLKQPAAIAVLLRLVARADVLVEAFRPGVAERLGFGPEPCLAGNPRLIYARMTGWGQSGPLSRAAGHDINYLALSGLLNQIGDRSGKPIPPLNVVGDFGGGGLLLAFGVLAAYIEAQRSGRGQVVDVAMIDGAASLLGMVLGNRAVGCWRDAPGMNWVSGRAHYYNTYATLDGRWVAIGAIEPQFHRALIDKLDLDPELFEAGSGFSGERYDALVDEVWPRLERAVAEAVRRRTQSELVALFEGSDGCLTPVLKLDEAFEHPHHRARETFIPVGGMLQNAPAPRFSRTAADSPHPAPRIGEHTEAVLAAHGYSSAEIAELLRSGAAMRPTPWTS